ncbi:tetratricopeptide repeat protein [Pseudooceanicola sp. CBS1P-1]|uniref:Tetratricopeptide repeat protein n=1 Tax=Pseudooceanicola albus TaxID=2692189 RepID=A0A6L7G384_9RHOB|nr:MULTISPECIES: tetratricopeptide repeat protein [Pseudooceanicola]MBT9384844.1 tetratricopeptide repeat protein [Pseudooceanicola endophyticus]MXN18162.1 tetratricopeptide repeat protein [Pseudooceanicola albus]
MSLRRLSAQVSALALAIALPLQVMAESTAPDRTDTPVHVQGFPTAPGVTGLYLTAQVALSRNDFVSAADFYRRALEKAPMNPVIMGHMIDAELAGGEFSRAIEPSRQLLAAGITSDLAQIVLMMDGVHQGHYAEVIDRIGETPSLGPLGSGLLKAWMQIGEGDMQDALAQFDSLGKTDGLARFAAYHKALALSYMGDFQAAENIYEKQSDGGTTMTRRGAVARIETLSQLGRDPEALALLDRLFGADLDPELEGLRSTLASGKTLPYTTVTSVSDGAAEAFYTIAAALQSELPPRATLLYARLAEALRPDHVEAVLLTGSLLEKLDQPGLAAASYLRVPRDNPAFYRAETARAGALKAAGRSDAARDVLDQLATSYPDVPAVHTARGNFYRQIGDLPEARRSFDTALQLYAETDGRRWFALYARGMCEEKLGDWRAAQRDFRAALKINPNNANLLNYFGYSMVEKKQDMTQALAMIEQAVKLNPDAGYIVDSLGWAYFTMGRAQDAVAPMERAVELMPRSAEVNDHLGDVYWAVGRKLEARFQWRRALSMAPAPAEADRIHRKLNAGLDAVLAEEARPVHQVAQD